jgi:hypothetical protein
MFSFYRILVIQSSNFETVIISHTIQLPPTSSVRVVLFNATFNNISVIFLNSFLILGTQHQKKEAAATGKPIEKEEQASKSSSPDD